MINFNSTNSDQQSTKPQATLAKRSAMKSLRILILIFLLSAIGFQWISPMQTAKADVAAGFSEYFIPGAADDVWDILNDLSTFSGNNFTNVITMPITTPNLTVYYDHWENGYLSGAAGDEVYSGYAVGSVLTFKSPQVPSNPRGTTLAACAGSTNPSGTTSNCYDGMDRIFVVGGAVSIAQVYWPYGEGTVYANAWEVYPVKAWESSYSMPVGENLYVTNTTAYADFDCVYVLVEAKEDDTQVTFNNTRTSAPGSGACGNSWWADGSVTLAKGKTYFRGGVNSASTIVSTKPVEVQFIVGREDSTYDSRSHTLVPSGQWDKEYYSPVPSYSGTNVNIYLYNPTGSTLAVTYQDTSGTATCNVPAGGTLSIRACLGRFVAAGSAVHLTAASNFFAIGEYDSGSSSRNWGFSIIPKASLNSEYFLPWAPGDYNVPPTSNGSPVYVTPTVANQVIYVDYSPITTPPTTEATYTLSLLQVQKIRDADNDNTGMHVWSDFPFAMTWGEDAQYAGTGNPYIDAGYTILPPNPNWIDVALDVDKSANPEVISLLVGETVEFTVDVKTNLLPLDNFFIEDYLPPYFAYVAGTTQITWPGGTYTANPTITGAAATGYTLHWGTAPDNIGDLGANQTMTLKFTAITVTGFNAASSVNNTSATGYWGSTPLTATGQATVIAGSPGHIVVIKDAIPDAPQDFPFALINQAKPNDPTHFTLDDDADGTYANTAQFGLRPGNYTVEETSVAGWYLYSATCTSSVAGNTPTPANIPLAAGETVTCTFTNTQADWGDLPDSYATSLDQNGPRHIPFKDTNGDGLPNSSGGNSAIWLGSMIIQSDAVVSGVGKFDTEVNGQPTSDASGDDANGAAPDDEDGVLLTTFVNYTHTLSIDVRCTSSEATAAGWLVVWFDWDHSNSFDSSEATFNQSVNCSSAGVTQSLTYIYPGSRSSMYYRVRLFDPSTYKPADPTSAFTGLYWNGEVEDYYYPNDPTSATVSPPTASAADQAILVSWETFSELDILSFKLYRATDPAALPEARALVYETPAKHPGKLDGDVYEYNDTDVQSGTTYTYWLAVHLKNGSVVTLDPASASLPGAGFKIFLPALRR
jgi:hypothetical protein